LHAAKEARRITRSQFAKDDKRRIYTQFFAASAFDSGLHLLSNLSAAPFTLVWPATEGVPPHLRGQHCVYDSSEHAYQALKTLDRESARQFETGGIVCMEIFKRWPRGGGGGTADIYEAKMKHWGLKGPGIAAKMVANLDSGVAREAFGLRMMRRELPAAGMSDELKVWGPILRQKFFYNSDARNVLIGTKNDILIEKSRMPPSGRGAYWAGYVSADPSNTDGKVVGQNMMGRLLMHIRSEIVAELD
jgi:predicted NAD-dependent protein-ADP-ribosyltransferase YbiA (DUF1768 family)